FAFELELLSPARDDTEGNGDDCDHNDRGGQATFFEDLPVAKAPRRRQDDHPPLTAIGNGHSGEPGNRRSTRQAKASCLVPRNHDALFAAAESLAHAIGRNDAIVCREKARCVRPRDEDEHLARLFEALRSREQLVHDVVRQYPRTSAWPRSETRESVL